MEFQSDTDAEQQFTRARFGRVAVVLGEFRFEFGSFHVIVVGGIGIGINGIALHHGLPHFGMPHHDDVQHTHVFVCELVLTQFAKPFARIEHDGSGSRFQITAQNFHEGRFAGAIGSDQAITVSFAELDGYVFKQRPGAELHGDIGC